MLHGKRSDMVVHEEEPFNVETARGALAEASVTSNVGRSSPTTAGAARVAPPSLFKNT